MMNILNRVPAETFACLAQSLQSSVEDTGETLDKLHLSTRNCNSSLKMDFVNTNLENCDSDLELNRIHKGPWTLSILFSKEFQLILAFVKKERFEGLLEKPDFERPKYMNGLAYFNKKEKGRKSQCNLFGYAEYDDEYVDFKMVDMFRKCCGDIENVRSAFVVYEDDGTQLTYVRVCVVDYNFCKVEELNLLDMLNVAIPSAPETTPIQDVDEPQMRLKQKALDRISAKEA